MTDAVTKTAMFAATPEIVWEFLTDKDKLGAWYHPARDHLVEGENYELMKAGGGDSVPQVWGRVLRADKPRKLVCTFIIAPFGDTETTVTWTLEPSAGGTRLTLLHEGIAAAGGDAALGMLRALDHGWDQHIQSLREGVDDS